MQTVAFRAESVHDMAEAIRERITADFKPALAIIFASVSAGIDELPAVLREFDFDVIGCSSCGEILDCGEGEVVSSFGVVGFLLDISRDVFTIRVFPAAEGKDNETGREIAHWGKANYAHPGYLILGSGLERNGDELVAGILDVAGNGTPLYGGLAGDDGNFQSTLVFNRAGLEAHGVLALVLDTDRMVMDGIAVGGWVGIGALKPVTRARGNVVYAIGGQPALDVYMDYLDISEGDMPSFGVDYPLLMESGKGTVLRAVMGANKDDRSLVFAGTVPEGVMVQFSVCPGSEVIAATVAAVRLFRERYGDADALLLFSCMARHLSLGPEVEDEIHQAREMWNTPLLGLFTYGEIGADSSRLCAFHNETFTLLALREKCS